MGLEAPESVFNLWPHSRVGFLLLQVSNQLLKQEFCLQVETEIFKLNIFFKNKLYVRTPFTTEKPFFCQQTSFCKFLSTVSFLSFDTLCNLNRKKENQEHPRPQLSHC